MKIGKFSKFIASVASAVFVLAALAACGKNPSDRPNDSSSALVSIGIGGAVKTRYRMGETFDSSGLIVTARYKDGTSKVLNTGEYELSAPSGKLIRDGSFTVEYSGKTAERSIRVVQGDGKTEAQIKSEFTSNKKSHVYNGYSVKFVERAPDYGPSESEPAPLVLFLHGSGERGNDNESQLKNSIAHAYDNIESMFYDSYVIAPQCPYRETEDGEDKPKTDDNVEYTKWVNRDWRSGSYNLSETPETKALATVANLVKTYAARPEIDASRVYVIGLSMGGYGTWDIIARHGELFAAAVPMCGGGPLDMAEALSDMPIYAFHATNDSAVPYGTGTKAMYDAIRAYDKNNMMLVTMGNDGHAIWDKVWKAGASEFTYKTEDNKDCPRIIDWMFAQYKA